MPLLADEVMRDWDNWLRAGARTYGDMADQFSITSKVAKKRIDRYRRRVANAATRNDQPKATAAPDEVLVGADRFESLQKIFDSLIETQAALKGADTTKPIIELELPETKPSLIVFPSDLHIGGVGTDHALMRSDFQLIASTPGAYAFCLGDHTDNYNPVHHPTGMLQTVAGPQLQWDLCEMVMRFLGDKLKGGVEGNHDRFSGKAGLTPCTTMYRNLGVDYLGPGGRVFVTLGSQKYRLELRHDFPFNSNMNTTNSQRRLSEITYGADVVALGHRHFSDLQHVWRYGVEQVWLRSATYKTRDAWAEGQDLQFGYAPVPPDMTAVIVWPDKKKVLPFRNFHDAVVHLRAIR